MNHDQLREATTQHRAAPMARAALQNLDALDGKQAATKASPWIKGPAFIVGAGPSLDLNADKLRGTIIAVNTSLPALLAKGITPDVVVTVETVGVTSQLDGYDGPIVASLCAHPDTFARATHFFTSTSAPMLPMSRSLGIPPLSYGGSVTTAAFSLARMWGATTIVLVGMDLSYPDGRCYATGAGWDGYEVETDDDVEFEGEVGLTFTGRPDRDEAHRSSGIPAIPRERKGHWVEAWGSSDDWANHDQGGPSVTELNQAKTVPTTAEMDIQRVWFEEQAAGAERAGLEVINCTEGGARIHGFEELELEDVTRFIPSHHHPSPRWPESAITRQQVLTAKQDLRDEADAVIRMCDAMDKHQPPDWGELLEGQLFCSGFAQGDLIGLKATQQLSPPEMIQATYATLRAAAEEVKETL